MDLATDTWAIVSNNAMHGELTAWGATPALRAINTARQVQLVCFCLSYANDKRAVERHTGQHFGLNPVVHLG